LSLDRPCRHVWLGQSSVGRRPDGSYTSDGYNTSFCRDYNLNINCTTRYYEHYFYPHYFDNRTHHDDGGHSDDTIDTSDTGDTGNTSDNYVPASDRRHSTNRSAAGYHIGGR
jgi:hypothetical protein